MNTDDDPAATRFLAPDRVLSALAAEARHALRQRSHGQTVVLAVLAGCFIAAGAYSSVLLSLGIASPGLSTLLLGIGFATGFFFVILTGAVLFTEVNVLIPALVLNMTTREFCRVFAIFWLLAALGNVIGAVALGTLINIAHPLPADVTDHLSELVHHKMTFFEEGTTSAWLRVVLSGMLANWLVGMAAFFATMGRSILEKYVPVLLAVSLFVAANFQHSPANVGYFALIMPTGAGPGWGAAITWNLVPAAIGNIIGATLFVALPLYYALGGHTEKSKEDQHET